MRTRAIPAFTRDPRLGFLLALGGWSAALLALLRSPWGEHAVVAPFTAWHAAFASGFAGGSAVVVDLSCSGSEVIALAMAALLAYPMRVRALWRRRLAGIGVALVWLGSLNLLRVITLVNTAGSPLFMPLHLYIWPAIMIGASVLFVAGWIWMSERSTTTRWIADSSRARRLAAAAGLFIVAYIAATPWLLRSELLQQFSVTLARAAAALLGLLGQPAVYGGSTLVVADRGFVVTPECIVTPLMPLYLAWSLTWPPDRRTRFVALAVFVPLFAALGFLRLLTVALPALIGPPLFVTHGFYQFLVAAILLLAAARWGARRSTATPPTVAQRVAWSVVTATVVGMIVAPYYSSLIRAAVDVLAAPPSATFSLGAHPEVDVQGALAIMPGFQLSLMCGLAVAIWGRRATRLMIVLVPAAAIIDVVTLSLAGRWSVGFAAEVPVTLVRALSLLTPCLLVAAASAWRLRPSPAQRPAPSS